MTKGLSLTQIALLAAYAAGMAGGQLLFKTAALQVPTGAPLASKLIGLLQKASWSTLIDDLSTPVARDALRLSLICSLGATALSVLFGFPLSRAYPFVAIAFALTPLLGGLVFAEPLSPRLLVGLAVILGGLYLVAG